MTAPCPDHAPNLYAALARAQSVMRGALKDSENPFFRSRYADLASVWDAIREPLTTNELCVLQFPEVAFSGAPETYTFKSKSGEDRSGVRIPTTVYVRTRLAHSSGEHVDDVVCAMLPSGDPQAVGSAITYLRRYALSAIVGVAPEDDDGEATARPVPASHREHHEHQRDERPAPAPAPVTLDSPIPFGKHSGKDGKSPAKTVREAGHGYFEYLSDQADFAESEGKAWHTFTLAALAAFDAEDSPLDRAARPVPLAEAAQPKLDLTDDDVPDVKLASADAVDQLRDLIERQEVPERTRKLYGAMLAGLGDKVTDLDVDKITRAVVKSVRAST